MKNMDYLFILVWNGILKLVMLVHEAWNTLISVEQTLDFGVGLYHALFVA